jgi:HEAT repeat protein
LKKHKGAKKSAGDAPNRGSGQTDSADRPSTFVRWLGRGDLRSDGQANEVAALVTQQPELLPDLVDALRSGDPATRGHAADALEKFARSHPGALEAFLPSLISAATRDEVGMVRWHLAMVFGHTAMISETVDASTEALLELLTDKNALVRSWAITSLCIISRLHSKHTRAIVEAVSRMKRDRSAAVAKRASRAIELMTIPALPFPKGWIKSRHIRSI